MLAILATCCPDASVYLARISEQELRTLREAVQKCPERVAAALEEVERQAQAATRRVRR